MRVSLVTGMAACAAFVLSCAACQRTQEAAAPVAAPAVSAEEVAALKGEVERLKGVAASASVAMADVGFHFSNLWFAGQAKNWPLATYCSVKK